jgi:hypothetical protein
VAYFMSKEGAAVSSWKVDGLRRELELRGMLVRQDLGVPALVARVRAAEALRPVQVDGPPEASLVVEVRQLGAHALA